MRWRFAEGMLMKKYITVSIFFLISTSLCARPGRLMMFVDESEASNYENISFPITMCCVEALYEKIGPVLMNAYVLRTIFNRYNEFIQIFEGDPRFESTKNLKKYDQLYQKIVTTITQELPKIVTVSNKNAQDIADELEKTIEQQLLSGKELPEFLASITKKSNPQIYWCNMLNGSLYEIIHGFNFDEWDIYAIHNAWYLFVPKSYRESIEAEYKQEKKNVFSGILHAMKLTDAATGRKLAEEEIALGLKIHNFEKMTKDQWTNFLLRETHVQIPGKIFQPGNDMRTFLKQVFINIDDMSKKGIERLATIYDMPEKTVMKSMLPCCTIYLRGHGGYETNMFIDNFPKLLKESTQLKNEIGFFVQADIEQFPEEKRKKIEQIFTLEKRITGMIDVSGGNIAGLSMVSYRQMLDFLNNDMSAVLLYYFTCYGGGRRLQLPFVSRAGDKMYDYTIMSEVSGDIPGYSTRSYFDLESAQIKVYVFYENGVPKVRLAFKSDINFTKFFTAVENKKSLREIMTSITYRAATNIPAIRLPGTSWFSAARLKNIAYVTHTAMATAGNEMHMTNKDVVLLYTPAVDREIVLTGGVPKFISMLPEQKIHWIKSINARYFLSTELVYNFLKELLPLKWFVGYKKFLIDTLHVKNNWGINTSKLLGVKPGDVLSLTNVVIFHGYESEVKASRGMLFMWRGKGYIVSYMDAAGRNIANPFDPNQLIRPLTQAESQYYREMYQENKNAAQQAAKELIDTTSLQQFTHKHVQIQQMNRPQMNENEKGLIMLEPEYIEEQEEQTEEQKRIKETEELEKKQKASGRRIVRRKKKNS